MFKQAKISLDRRSIFKKYFSHRAWYVADLANSIRQQIFMLCKPVLLNLLYLLLAYSFANKKDGLMGFFPRV